MKKVGTFRYFLFFSFVYFLFCLDVEAMKPIEFKDRVVCGEQYELAIAMDDGNLETVACYQDYYEAKAAMDSHESDNVVILARAYNKVYGETRTEIADSKYALLDLSVNTQKPYTYFFPDAGDYTGKDNYMDTGTLYQAVDGAYISVNWPNRVAHLKMAGYDGWVNFISSWTNWLTNDYQIVPLAWVKSSNYYVVDDSSIKHCLTKNIYAETTSPYCISLGPKPSMLNSGTYYSYDGKYFYLDRKTMLSDYKVGTYNQAVNKEVPYYNYYMYLPQHSRTTYSSVDIDNYIRNSLGYKATVFDEYDFVKNNSSLSKLYGQGTFFYNAQQTYGVNAIVMFGIARNESGNGRSRISIDKNNGFGDGAVDSDAYNQAKTYAAFANTIYAYAHNLFTYGYSNPIDWRYNGSVLGNKGVGMNIQYASDPYWSEKAASNYYRFDYTLSDYDFYQLGVTNQDNVVTYANSDYNSKKIYTYDRKDFPMIIVAEENGFYKVISDMNLDINKNQVTSGNYNWESSYVYVPVTYVNKINEGKNGMIGPDGVYHYADYDYTYEIYATNSTLYQADTLSVPKVAKLVSDTNFYYDAALTTKVNQDSFGGKHLRITKALKDTYVMVYAVAKDDSGNPVSYLVTSDYQYNQQDWIKAETLELVGLSYGKEYVDSGAHWAWVNSTPTDTSDTVISGFYNRTYFPILGEEVVDGIKWYKVPSDMNGNIGYVLANDVRCNVTYYQGEYIDKEPVITVSDKIITEGSTFDYLDGVKAEDTEDGDIVQFEFNKTVDINTPGIYEVTYTVVDSYGHRVSKTIKVTVIKDEEPVINANDLEITVGLDKIDLLNGVTATDKEDGTLDDISVDDSKVLYDVVGTYTVTYTVKDSFGHIVTKLVNLKVLENQKPVIYASDKTITIGSKFDPFDGVKAEDREDGDITSNIKVVLDEVNEEKIGSYKVTYKIEDAYKNVVEKSIIVEVINKKEVEGTFYFDYLDNINDKLQMQGYMTIQGMDNTLNEDIKYKVIFENVNDSNLTYEQEATRITDLSDINRPIYSPDGYTYTYAWFNINLDIDNLPSGNYIMYIKAEGEKVYSTSLINNKLYKKEITSFTGNNRKVNIKNNYSDRSSAVTLYVRDKNIISKTVDSYYNQYDIWRTFDFSLGKLHLKGASYSYGMDLSSNRNVERKLIFENNDTFEIYEFDLGSITDGLYTVALPVSDGYDKSRAWYDKTIDISSIPKGDYTLYITTTSNVTDISEFTDIMGRSLSDKKEKINDKNYQFYLDLENGNIIKLIVE